MVGGFLRRFAVFSLLGLVLPIAGAPGAAGQGLVHVTVISSPSDSGGEVYYAQARGTFKKYGLDVEIIDLAAAD
jgi:ABC-type nitrate/sulfonate/bicarbonate transport system substrate-binding protein